MRPVDLIPPLLAGTAILFVVGIARAEGLDTTRPPVTTAPNVDTAPDVVRLKDGGMVRGTIAEMDPNKSVVIVTLTGEKRTYDMKLVAYAGARNAEPTEKPPNNTERSETQSKPTEAAGPVLVSFKAEGEAKDVTLHMQIATQYVEGSYHNYALNASAESYTRLCTAPCKTKLGPGNYVFALSSGENRPINVDPIDIKGETALTGSYVSHDSRRGTGWLILVGSIFVGGAIALGPTIRGSSDGLSLPALGLGLVIAGTGTAIGAALAATDDEAILKLSK
jgi:hypothetical protein